MDVSTLVYTKQVCFNLQFSDPGAPELHQVSEIDNSSFYVSWAEPAIRNGQIINYNLSIINLGALYSIPDDAECTINERNFTFLLDSSETYFNFTDGSPFHNYAIFINAETSRGFGPISDIISANTIQAGKFFLRYLYYNAITILKHLPFIYFAVGCNYSSHYPVCPYGTNCPLQTLLVVSVFVQ